MDFSYFKRQLTKLSTAEIGGLKSQFKLAPEIRKQYSEDLIYAKNPQKAAVLVIFYPDSMGKLNFLLTERASYKGTHSAQISFPGGKLDSKDTSLKNTALRESNEEIGIITNDVFIFKQMTDVFIPPSNFIVTPFLSYINYTPLFKKNYEVEALIEVNLSNFLKDEALTSTTLSTSYANKIEVPCFKLNNYIVWGATAMMLSEIKDLLNKIQ